MFARFPKIRSRGIKIEEKTIPHRMHFMDKKISRHAFMAKPFEAIAQALKHEHVILILYLRLQSRENCANKTTNTIYKKYMISKSLGNLSLIFRQTIPLRHHHVGNNSCLNLKEWPFLRDLAIVIISESTFIVVR